MNRKQKLKAVEKPKKTLASQFEAAVVDPCAAFDTVWK